MDFEGTVITIFVALIASVAGGFIAWLFKSNERKTAVLDLADKLEDKRKQVADDVWKRGVSTVENMLEKNEAKTTSDKRRYTKHRPGSGQEISNIVGGVHSIATADRCKRYTANPSGE